MTRQRYRCPQCGKKVLFGEHLCLVGNKEDQSASDEVQEPRPSQAGGGLFKKLGVILIVAFLAGAMLWGFLPWVLTLILGLIILAGVEPFPTPVIEVWRNWLMKRKQWLNGSSLPN